MRGRQQVAPAPRSGRGKRALSILRCQVLLLLLACLLGTGTMRPGLTWSAQLYRGTPKQQDQILARILSREGRLEEALRLYQHLRKAYPEDQDIWADYAETLINARLYDRAWKELIALFEKNPRNPRTVRLMARLHQEQERYGTAAAWLEKLLRTGRGDPGLWADYAWIQQAAGDWANALDAFCRVLEMDPENVTALQAVHDILREHRPRLETKYRSYFQAEETRTDTFALEYRRHLDHKTTWRIQAMDTWVERPAGPAGPAIDEDIRQVRTWIAYRWNADMELWAQVGYHTGADDRLEWGAGLRFSGPWRTRSTLLLEDGLPWTDPADAAPRGGWSRRMQAVVDWNPDTPWFLSLTGEYEAFHLDDSQAYGNQRTLTVLGGRRLWETPDVTVGYSFTRSLFDYEEGVERDIAMIPSEAIHALFARAEFRPCRYLRLSLDAAVRRHAIRALDSYMLLPALELRLGNRISATASYEYSSESSTASGGITRTLEFRLRIIF
ncbi:Tetratricopeptide repeat-containing protein [Desulfacinum hydrothermale DSM 13146]|uniref:Tetratricopeptide repeat-containing protein n=1 Tax=Desulfacinum hydrothermale DSM 13146 TaxID=1121390 RepID=A0A1W1X7Z8_9BACT|nr:tetratricopeptide repeat protein [Desulfacinum hydrothermale]SMC20105.1 Tetratricopeptide repeat-containing protein [Desulfacinum hydrothermale DSM 13146]